MLIFYRANWISYLLFLLFKRVQYVGWPNLLAGKKIVPELIQLDCRAEQLVKHTQDFLDVPGIEEETTKQLKQIRNTLGPGNFAIIGAREIFKILEQKRSQQVTVN
jgi:lipid-A-disaccharide synthase